MQDEKKAMVSRKVYKGLAAVCAAGGLVLAVLASGTEDARLEASQAQQEKLASPKTTRTMAFVSIAAMLSAVLLHAKSQQQK